MEKIKPLIIPSALLILSFVLRFTLMSKGPYHGDSLNLALQAEQTILTGKLQMAHMWMGFPLTVIISSIFIAVSKVFGINDPVLAVNFMSVVFGSLSVLLLYFLAKELLDRSTAIFSAILFSLSPICLGESVYGKSHTPSMFFLILGMYLLVKSFRTGLKNNILLAGVFLGCFGAARLHDLVLMAIPISYLYFFIPGQNNIPNAEEKTVPDGKTFIIFYLTIILTVAVFYLPYFIQTNNPIKIRNIPYYFDYGVTQNFIGIFSYKIFKGFLFLKQNFTVYGLGMAAGGLILLAIKRLKILGFLLAWFLIPFLFYANLKMTVTSRYFLLVLPPVCIMQGYLLHKFTEKKFLLKAAAYGVLILLSCTMYNSIYRTLKFRHDHALLPEFAQWVGKNTEPHAKVIAADEGLFIQHYGSRSLIYRPASGVLGYAEDQLNQFAADIDAMLENNMPVYITTVSLYSYDRGAEFSSFFKDHYSGELIGKHYYEDYHQGAMKLSIILCSLYRVRKISPGFPGNSKPWDEKEGDLFGYHLW